MIKFVNVGKNVAIYVAIVVILSILAMSIMISDNSIDAVVNAPTTSCNDGVMLTFNVYQGANEIYEIIKILNDYGVSATFFIGGCWANKNIETVKLIDDNGFRIGSHGFYHYDHSALSYQQNFDEIKKSIDLLESIINKKITLFAPPSGAYNKSCLDACDTLGLTTVMWSVDTIDWRDQDKNIIIKRATANVKNKDIILMHPTSATVSALPTIIENILSKGLHIFH